MHLIITRAQHTITLSQLIHHPADLITTRPRQSDLHSLVPQLHTYLIPQPTTKMSWDHDVCLSCDNQTHDGGKFCSQACRLADLERAGFSAPPTPASLPTNAPSWDSWQMPTTTSTKRSSSRRQFQLAPAVNFSAYRSNPNFESPPASPTSRRSVRPQSTSYFAQQTTYNTTSSQPTGRGLALSPSRTSLSSVSSSSSSASTPGLSEQTMNQLRDYSGAFDTVRDWKRRVTFS